MASVAMQVRETPPVMSQRSDDPTTGHGASTERRPREPSLEIELDTAEARPSGELSPELPSLRRFAGYELLGRLAVGGMAEVFVARERSDAGGARLVALKVVRAHLESDASFGEMFLREGQVALGLRHPNICHVYRFGAEAGHSFMAMELVTGITVQSLLTRANKARRPLPAPLAVKIASAVAEALHSAHAARDSRGRPLRVVHQDVSPHNLMVAHDGTVKLLDFGVAQSTMEGVASGVAAGNEPSHTTIRGKFAYLAPEQCRGLEVDPRTDVFSLGICLFEMLTGHRLFKRSSSIEMLNAVVTSPMPAPSSLGVDVPAALVRVLERALQKEPRDRYQSAAEMQDDLEQFLAGERLVVTSAKIAEYLADLLGDEAGRPAKLDTRPEVVAWLRSDPTAAPAPVPIAEREPARAPRGWAGAAIAAVVIAVVAIGVAIWAAGDPPTAAGPATPSTTVVPLQAGAPEHAPPRVGEDAREPPREATEATDVEAPEREGDAIAAPEAESDAEARRREAREARQRRRAAKQAAPGGFVQEPGF